MSKGHISDVSTINISDQLGIISKASIQLT